MNSTGQFQQSPLVSQAQDHHHLQFATASNSTELDQTVLQDSRNFHQNHDLSLQEHRLDSQREYNTPDAQEPISHFKHLQIQCLLRQEHNSMQ